jgi:hypothetical protein
MSLHKQSACDEHVIVQKPIIVEEKFSMYFLANIFYWNILAGIAPEVYTFLEY